jgi:hypothetical protein
MITEKDIKKVVWYYVDHSVWSSVEDSVRDSVEGSVEDSVWSSVGESVETFGENSVKEELRERSLRSENQNFKN